jgi:hypothetical protein
MQEAADFWEARAPARGARRAGGRDCQAGGSEASQCFCCWWTRTRFRAGGPVGNSADTAARDSQASDRVQRKREQRASSGKRQTTGGESKIRCAPSCDSCQQRARLGAGLPAGIGRDSRLPSADGTASVSLRRVIRPAQARVNRLYLDSHGAGSVRREEPQGVGGQLLTSAQRLGQEPTVGSLRPSRPDSCFNRGNSSRRSEWCVAGMAVLNGTEGMVAGN